MRTSVIQSSISSIVIVMLSMLQCSAAASSSVLVNLEYPLTQPVYSSNHTVAKPSVRAAPDVRSRCAEKWFPALCPDGFQRIGGKKEHDRTTSGPCGGRPHRSNGVRTSPAIRQTGNQLNRGRSWMGKSVPKINFKKNTNAKTT